MAHPRSVEPPTRPSHYRSASTSSTPLSGRPLSLAASSPAALFRVDQSNPNIIHGSPGSGSYYDLTGAHQLYPNVGPSGYSPGNYPPATLPDGRPNPAYMAVRKEIDKEDMRSTILRQGDSNWRPGQPRPPTIRNLSSGQPPLGVPPQLSSYPPRPVPPALSRSNSIAAMDISRPGTPLSRPGTPTSLSRSSSWAQMPPPPLPSKRPSSTNLRDTTSPSPNRYHSSSLPRPTKPTLPSLKSTGLLDVGGGKSLPGGSSFAGPSLSPSSYSYNSHPMPHSLQRRLSRGSSSSLYSTAQFQSSSSGLFSPSYDGTTYPQSSTSSYRPPQFSSGRYPFGSSPSSVSSSAGGSSLYSERPSSSMAISRPSSPTPAYRSNAPYPHGGAQQTSPSRAPQQAISTSSTPPAQPPPGWDPSRLIGGKSKQQPSSKR